MFDTKRTMEKQLDNVTERNVQRRPIQTEAREGQDGPRVELGEVKVAIMDDRTVTKSYVEYEEEVITLSQQMGVPSRGIIAIHDKRKEQKRIIETDTNKYLTVLMDKLVGKLLGRSTEYRGYCAVLRKHMATLDSNDTRLCYTIMYTAGASEFLLSIDTDYSLVLMPRPDPGAMRDNLSCLFIRNRPPTGNCETIESLQYKDVYLVYNKDTERAEFQRHTHVNNLPGQMFNLYRCPRKGLQIAGLFAQCCAKTVVHADDDSE